MPGSAFPSAGAFGFALAMVTAAGLIRGFTGFGFSITAVSLLSLLAPPARAVPVVVMLQFLVSVSGLPAALRLCDWRSLRLLALGALIATPFGVWGLAHLPEALVRLAIAGIVLFAAILLLRGLHLDVTPRGLGVVAFGMVAGLFNGLAGMSGPPVIAFYLASPVEGAVARASMIVFFVATSSIALVPLLALGGLGRANMLAAAGSFPFAWAGTLTGAMLFRRTPEARARRVSRTLLLAISLLATVRAALAFA